MANNEWGAFETATETGNYNIVGASQGNGGSGKTHFWLTAPDPIAYFLFDPGGLKSLTSRDEFKHKDIRVVDFSKMLNYGRIPKEDRVKAALDASNVFEESWEVAKKKARTAIIDKEDALWEMVRYAHDEVDSPDPKSFGELNTQYRGYFTDAENSGMNLGVLRGMKEVWGKLPDINPRTGKPKMGFTGEFVPRGQKEVVELVQINLDHRWDEEERCFKVKILDKCRLGNALNLLGKEFSNMDFLTLAVELYPEADPSVWGL